jgi:hypothetical protein
LFAGVVVDGSMLLSDPEFIWRFERGTALWTDDGSAIAAGEGIGDLKRALRTIQRWRLGSRFRGLRLVWSHEDGKCSIEEQLRAMSLELRAGSILLYVNSRLHDFYFSQY